MPPAPLLPPTVNVTPASSTRDRANAAGDPEPAAGDTFVDALQAASRRREQDERGTDEKTPATADATVVPQDALALLASSGLMLPGSPEIVAAVETRDEVAADDAFRGTRIGLPAISTDDAHRSSPRRTMPEAAADVAPVDTDPMRALGAAIAESASGGPEQGNGEELRAAAATKPREPRPVSKWPFEATTNAPARPATDGAPTPDLASVSPALEASQRSRATTDAAAAAADARRDGATPADIRARRAPVVAVEAASGMTSSPDMAPAQAASAHPVEASAASSSASTTAAPPSPLHLSAVAAARPEPATASIAAPVGAPAWRDEIAQTVAHVAARGHDRAELRLNPAELGPVEVRIDLRAGEATVLFVASSAPTRDALEQALPQLREQLAAQGIALGDASVHDGRHEPSESPREPSPYRASPTDGERPAVVEPRRTTRGNGLVDTFA